jgi:hypothetical protein
MILNSFVALVAALFAFAPLFAPESAAAAVLTSAMCVAVAVFAVLSIHRREYRTGVWVGGSILALTAFAFPPDVFTMAGQLSVAYFFFAAGVAPQVKVVQPVEVEMELRRAA